MTFCTMRKVYHILGLFLIFSLAASGQVDTTILKLDELSWEDISSKKKKLKKNKVRTGSRLEQDRRDVISNVFVITSEDIRNHDYNTLVDVLSSLPGIRFSQPGSAEAGETFMMRGLYGNAYTKILINDIPIKPYVINNMPISAQLPIKQAERIEIIFGPQAALYGVDAAAGVINIILPDTENPETVDVQMGLGAEGYRSVNVKAGSQIRIGKQKVGIYAFGGFTGIDDLNVIPKDDPRLFNPQSYDLGTSVIPHTQRANYVGTEDAALVRKMPAESSYIGYRLGINNFTLGGITMTRKDHSSFGLNPKYTSYANPANFMGEKISNLFIDFQKSVGKFSFISRLDFLNYNLDPQANTDRISTDYLEAADQVLGLDGITESDVEILSGLHADLIDGESYSYSWSDEVSFEQIINYRFNSRYSLLTGVRFQFGKGNALLDGFFRNSSDEFGEDAIAAIEEQYGSFFKSQYDNYTTFSQLLVDYDRLKLGFNLHYGSNILSEFSINIDNYNVLLAALYVLNEKLRLRGSFGTALRSPSIFFSSNSFRFSAEDQSLKFTENPLQSETSKSVELGLTYEEDEKYYFNTVIFYSRNDNYINYTLNLELDDNDFAVGTSLFENNPRSRIILAGLQFYGSAKYSDVSWKPEFGMALNAGVGKESITVPATLNSPQNIVEFGSLRSYPTFMAQFDVKLTPHKQSLLIAEGTFNTRALNRGLDNVIRLSNGEEPTFTDAFFRLNVIGRYKFSDKFDVALKISNLLDANYGGIDVTDGLGNLLYNPQRRRYYFFSVNYNY